jgi:ABC-type dipeptide/oligopeptide/nickel transport system permease subunit
VTTTAERLPEAADAERVVERENAGLWRDTLANLLRQRSAVVGLILLAILAFVAIFAPLLATHPANQSMLELGEDVSRQRPDTLAPCIHLLGCPQARPQHFFGLDGLTRDVYSRVVYGSRVSLYVGFVTVGFAIVIGSVLGALAGWLRGRSDNVIMRLMDVVLSFPGLLLAIVIVTVLGPGLLNAQIAIGIVAIPIYARVMRASVLSIRERDFVTASLALGESSIGVLARRIVPNAITPVIVQGTLGIGVAILEVAALSFIGLGAQPPTAEWGSMISLERTLMTTSPHLIIFPGIAIVITVLAFNLLGDGLRDALDPRLHR